MGSVNRRLISYYQVIFVKQLSICQIAKVLSILKFKYLAKSRHRLTKRTIQKQAIRKPFGVFFPHLVHTVKIPSNLLRLKRQKR
jgi:hypothetical protein